MSKLVPALLLLVASPAFGQAFTHPGGDQGADWTELSTKPTGAAPADAYEPADPGDIGFDEEDWIVVGVGGPGYVEDPDAERKIRITCEPSTEEHEDFILGYGVANFGHLHQGTGKAVWDSTADFDSNRANPSSTCTGGPLNATLYIEPAMLKELPNGAVATMRPQDQTFYYITGIQSVANTATWLRRDTAFILGASPSNYNDAARRAEYAAAGFEYPGSPETPAGFHGWQCYRGSDGALITVSRTASRMQTSSGAVDSGAARHLKAEDDSDPWGGSCTGSEAAPGELILNLSAPGCWDRHNLRAPDGRAHFWYSARTPDNEITNACPTTDEGEDYGQVPALQVKTHFRHAGFADYGEWYLASDRMNAADAPADATSLDPCREIGAWFCNGSTAHADWGYGWKSAIFDEAQRECLGITVRGVAPTDGPAECNDSQISKTRKLLTGGASPDSTMSGGCTTIRSCSDAVPGNIERYNPLEAGAPVPGAVEHVLH